MTNDENNNKQERDIEMSTGSDIRNQANMIIDTAKNQVTAENDGPILKDESIANKFCGLPMRELIAAPLLAAAESQQKLAATALEFYDKIAFETDSQGKSTGKTKTIDFTLERPIEQDGKLTLMQQKVSAPFIGLVPIPSLLIDKIDVDFQMEVTDTNVSTTKTDASSESDVSSKAWFVSAKISGKVSTSQENTRTTNQTAKYQVHVSASQQPQTEGLSKLMDIMASCIEPISVPS